MGVDDEVFTLPRSKEIKIAKGKNKTIRTFLRIGRGLMPIDGLIGAACLAHFTHGPVSLFSLSLFVGGYDRNSDRRRMPPYNICYAVVFGDETYAISSNFCLYHNPEKR